MTTTPSKSGLTPTTAVERPTREMISVCLCFRNRLISVCSRATPPARKSAWVSDKTRTGALKSNSLPSPVGPGRQLGVEIVYHDDDDGGMADHRRGWSGTSTTPVADFPAQFNNVILVP